MFTQENKLFSKKVMLVFGTRPEAIKMCPIVIELQKRKANIVVCVTGQHKEMLQQVLEVFRVKVDYNLEIMQANQNLFDVTNLVMNGTKEILEKEKPDIVLVHGDTSTAYATALSCFYLRIPVAHIEAGLRTYDMLSPYPEEFNRQSIDLISSLYFAPTNRARENLLKEGKADKRIFVTGNTVIDALKTTISKEYHHDYFDWIGKNRLILLTVHRRENLGNPMYHIFQALKQIAQEYSDVRIIYPVHKNPRVREIAYDVFDKIENVLLIEPLDVIDFHNFMNKSYLVVTDSGGIQEEAPSLGKPVIVVRNTTERPEGIEAGTLKLVGTQEKAIYKNVKELLDNKKAYQNMSNIENPYGDGNASKRIVDILETGKW